ncbi:type II secretion system protein M [compost metagenome]
MQGGAGLNLERLRQSAQARRIELAEVDAQGKTWQLRGQVADEWVLQGWLQSLRAEGAQPLQWGLEQDGKGLRFELVVQP